MEATAISLVFDASPDQANYKGPGFHHPGKVVFIQATKRYNIVAGIADLKK
jgi:hypothetical protein